MYYTTSFPAHLTIQIGNKRKHVVLLAFIELVIQRSSLVEVVSPVSGISDNVFFIVIF